MNNLKKTKFLIVNIIVMLIIFMPTSKAVEQEFEAMEKSEIFAKWEDLPDEEREDTIQPSYMSFGIEDTVKKSTYNALMELENSANSSYRINGLTVKNQQKSGMCWAFAFSSVLEGSGSGNIYSPAYLDYVITKSFNKKQGSGANYYLALASSASGKNPVLESQMPFSSVYNEEKNTSSTYYLTPIENLSDDELNKTVQARIMDTTEFASICKEIDTNKNITYTDGITQYNTDSNNNNIPDEVESIRTLIKEHIKNEGPVAACIYSDLAYDSNNNIVSLEGYYNTKYSALFCNNSDKVANHNITIIGWDDSYAVSNFNEKIAPSNPGAYIVLNSYGEEFGNDGYMYVSYEDIFIEQTVFGINDLEEYKTEDDIAYDKIYQYDELGPSYTIGTSNVNLTPMAANVFSRDSSKREYLNEVGIFLNTTEGVEIYVNSADSDKTRLTPVAVETDNITPGYHVIKLANPVELTGDKFVLAVKYTNTQDGATIPVESNLVDSGLSTTSNYFDKATANENESFVSLDNGQTWSDIQNLQISDSVIFKNTNICIKGYTTEISGITQVPVEKVDLDKTRLSMIVGDIDTLIATITPSNATNQKITWTSSNTDIATVSDSGVITAIATGTTIIKATSDDGKYTATCEVTVSEKVTTEDDIYKSSDNLNNTNTDNNILSVEKNEVNQNELNITVLPYTGLKEKIACCTAMFIIITVIISRKYKKLKDIK